MQANLTAPASRPTLRNHIACLESLASDPTISDIEWTELRAEIDRLRATLRRGGR